MLQKDSLFRRRDETRPRFSFSQDTAPTTAAAATPTPPAALTPAPQAEPPKSTTQGERKEAKLIVGPDIKMKGVEVTDCDTLVVEGRMEATLDSRVIQIAEHGIFSGTVAVDSAEIHGCLEGDLTVRKELIIHGTGKVSGKIRYAKLKVEEGAELTGEISRLDRAQQTPTGTTRHQG
jgi:cytoskeletal protein CcmA (bactofilin family)